MPMSPCRRNDAPVRATSRARAGIALLLLVLQVSGCYTYVPVPLTATPAGAPISVTINDRGRVALNDEFGPGLRRINGTLLASNDSTVEISMTSIEYFDLNVAARMDGKRAEIRRDYSAEYRERRLSRARTALTIGLAVVGLVATSFVAISGFGGDDPGDRPGNGGGGGTQ